VLDDCLGTPNTPEGWVPPSGRPRRFVVYGLRTAQTLVLVT